MQAFKVESFNIWAESQQEADDMRKALIGFIEEHGKQGRYVTAAKITDAISHWKDNALIRNRVIEHFQNK